LLKPNKVEAIVGPNLLTQENGPGGWSKDEGKPEMDIPLEEDSQSSQIRGHTSQLLL
jgi:hypothetical protein